MGIRAVIFDLDGTLYNYDKCNVLAEKELFRYIADSLEMTIDEVKRIYYKSKLDIKKQLGNTASSHNRMLYLQKLCEYIGINPTLYVRRFYNVYWDVILKNAQLYQWVIPVFEMLHHSNVSVNIVTDLTSDIQFRKIEALEIGKYIDTITVSEEAGEEKPSERIFNLAISKICVSKDQIAMIGDDINRDIEGARNFGIRSLLYKEGMGIEEILYWIFEGKN